MIVMFMVLVVFVPSILVEGEGVDKGPLVALAVPTESASSQRSTDQKNKADGLSENSHLGLQVVAQTTSTAQTGTGKAVATFIHGSNAIS